MNILLLHAHPNPESYNAALARAARSALEARGHAVDFCDLYAERFDPVLTREDRLRYHDPTANRAGVEGHVARLQAAEGLVVVAPVWNFGPPAILKGYYDRVFLPGVSFEFVEGRVRGALRNVRRLSVVATYGAHRWRAVLAGDPPRRFATRVLRAVMRGSPVDYHALYDMNRVSPEARADFLARVEKGMSRF